MSVLESALQLASVWGLPPDTAMGASGSEVAAVRWRHALPAFDDATLPHNVICFMMSPARSFRIFGKTRQGAAAERNGLGLMPAGSYGSWIFENPIDVLHLYVPQSFLIEVNAGQAVELREALRLDDPFLQTLMTEVCAAMRSGESGRLYVDTLGATAAMRLLRTRASGLTTEHFRGGLAPWQLRRCQEVIAAHLDQGLSLSSIAEEVGLSLFHCARAFKQSTGLPPHAYMRKLKTARAKELLETTDQSVSEIAAAVGYETPQAFARMFRAEAGVSPSGFRRLVRL